MLAEKSEETVGVCMNNLQSAELRKIWVDLTVAAKAIKLFVCWQWQIYFHKNEFHTFARIFEREAERMLVSVH